MKTLRVRRFDLGELRESSKTPQGFLKVPGFATRTGVFPYMDAGGKMRLELRHPDDVFDQASMETLKYAPITIEHPPEMVTPQNVAEYSVGHTTERVEKLDEKLDTDLIIEQERGIDAVEKEGIRELSCGYEADIVEEPGVYNGAPYDFRQVNIRYNHLALVKRGRAGPEIRLRLDSADAIQQGKVSEPTAAESSQESQMDAEETNAIGEPSSKKIVVLGQEVDLPSDVADTVQEFLDRYDEMRAKLSLLEESMGKRHDQKDADISQSGVSPQVKVEQQTPDGRSTSGKTGAKPGTITGPVGKADEEKDDADEEKKDEDEKKDADEKEDADEDKKDGEEEEKKDGEEKEDAEPAKSPVDRMKADLEAIRGAYKDDPDTAAAKMDALEGKLDAFAASSFGKGEKRGDSKGARGASRTGTETYSREQVRARVRLERQAEKLVPFDVAKRFDSMSDDEIRASVIKHHNPKADLKGKSSVYLEARFDSFAESFEDESASESRREAGKRMLGIDGEGNERFDGEDVDPNKARLKMVQSGREEYKQPLSASKK